MKNKNTPGVRTDSQLQKRCVNVLDDLWITCNFVKLYPQTALGHMEKNPSLIISKLFCRFQTGINWDNNPWKLKSQYLWEKKGLICVDIWLSYDSEKDTLYLMQSRCCSCICWLCRPKQPITSSFFHLSWFCLRCLPCIERHRAAGNSGSILCLIDCDCLIFVKAVHDWW